MNAPGLFPDGMEESAFLTLRRFTYLVVGFVYAGFRSMIRSSWGSAGTFRSGGTGTFCCRCAGLLAFFHVLVRNFLTRLASRYFLRCTDCRRNDPLEQQAGRHRCAGSTFTAIGHTTSGRTWGAGLGLDIRKEKSTHQNGHHKHVFHNRSL